MKHAVDYRPRVVGRAEKCNLAAIVETRNMKPPPRQQSPPIAWRKLDSESPCPSLSVVLPAVQSVVAGVRSTPCTVHGNSCSPAAVKSASRSLLEVDGQCRPGVARVGHTHHQRACSPLHSSVADRHQHRLLLSYRFWLLSPPWRELPHRGPGGIGQPWHRSLGCNGDYLFTVRQRGTLALVWSTLFCHRGHSLHDQTIDVIEAVLIAKTDRFRIQMLFPKCQSFLRSL
jgi:hypothetical protein